LDNRRSHRRPGLDDTSSERRTRELNNSSRSKSNRYRDSDRDRDRDRDRRR
jgi:hypothetical protein